MKKVSLFGVVLAASCVQCAHAAWTEISLAGAQAWASSEANADQTAMKVIDGSGFAPGLACPSGTVDTVSSNMWLAKSDDQSNHWWMVKFPTTVSVGALKLWNYNAEGAAKNGIKGTEIYISTDENIAIPTEKVGESLVMPKANWKLVHPYAFFTKASAAADDVGVAPHCLGGNQQARYLLVRQIFQWNSGTSAAPGISEIKFYNHTWEAGEVKDGKLILSDGFWQVNMQVLDSSAKTLQAGTGGSWQQWQYGGCGYLSGEGDIDFTDVFAQTGWKVTKLRECVFNSNNYGTEKSITVSGCFAPDVVTTGGSVFMGQERFTYVRTSAAMPTLRWTDFQTTAGAYGNGYWMDPGVYTSALTEMGANNQFATAVKFKNNLDFSKCVNLTTLPKQTLFRSSGCGSVVWPTTITTVGGEAFAETDLTMTFKGPPPATYDASSFDSRSNNSFLTIYCNNKKYPAWNDWVTTPLSENEKKRYPDGIGWSMNGVSSGKHANLLRALPQQGLLFLVR